MLLGLPSEGVPSRRPLSVQSYGITDVGRQRKSNEDQFLIATFTKALQVHQSSLPQSSVHYAHEHGYLFVVADGMGGHRGGEQASAIAVDAIEKFLLNTVTWLTTSGEREADLIHELRLALRRANVKVRNEAARNPELSGMGTTLTVACSFGSELFVAHAGDSRCYVLRAGELHQLTQDHTLVNELEQQGVIGPEQAAQHPFRHYITNAVGGGTAGLRADVCRAHLEPGDVLLLCTDGLTGMLPNARIAQILATVSDAHAACKVLVTLANEAGGEDNVTAIVARYEAPGDRPSGIFRAH